MSIDKSTLKLKFEESINLFNVYNATGNLTESAISVNLAIDALDEIPIFTVPTKTLLPFLNVYDSPDSIICFIEDIAVFAISVAGKWISFDGRFIISDNTLAAIFAWGLNSYGRLGDGTATDRSSPVSAIGGFTDWCQVAAGAFHTAAVRMNGTAWAWGGNGSGRLGDGTATNRSSPVSVAGGFSDWCQVAAGNYHTAAVRTNGTAWAWGSNDRGQLGHNTATTCSRSSPVAVVGGFTDWCQVAAGVQHTAAVRTNGSLWAWGYNASGRLGDGTVTNRSSPVAVVGGFTDWCQVAAGVRHTAAVRTNGSLWAWGAGGVGRLGDNTTVGKSSPVSVVGGFSDWCQVAAGNTHTAAVRLNGTLWAWGSNGFGQLGDATTTSRSSPVAVVGGFADWCQVSAGGEHTAAVRTNGTAWAWGLNSSGPLGDGTATNRSSPVSVAGGFTDWCQVAAGCAHTAAIKIII